MQPLNNGGSNLARKAQPDLSTKASVCDALCDSFDLNTYQ